MPLIIDGYNLLYVTGIVGKDDGIRGPLQRSREALLNFLAASISPSELTQTTVVFDAADAPPGLPRKLTYKGMTIHYASDYTDADALIERLIMDHHAPRSLTVVSSDHRIQRAARRRRATCVDSDRWYSELWTQRLARQKDLLPDKPVTQLSPEEIEYWVAKFTGSNDANQPPT